MDKHLISVFRFDGYNVDYIDYKKNENFKYNGPIDIDFKLGVEVKANNDDFKGKVTIKLLLFDNPEERNYPYSLRLSTSGYFSTNKECQMKSDDFLKYCKLNGTAAMFPFLRSIVADITKTADNEALILPLVNIQNLIKKDKGQIKME